MKEETAQQIINGIKEQDEYSIQARDGIGVDMLECGHVEEVMERF